MSQSTRKRIVFAVFLVAAAWGLYSQPWTHIGASRPHQAGVNSPDTLGIRAAVVATAASVAERPTVGAMAKEWTVDPFRSKFPTKTPIVPNRAPETEPEPPPLLQGMMTVGDEPVCVISGQVVRKGDRVGGWRVDAIASDRGDMARVSDGRRL